MLLISKYLLDSVAPFRTFRCYNSSPARQLSSEAVNAKRDRWTKERRWKRTRSEEHRVEYRSACRKANFLINQSRNKLQFRKIHECSSNPRRKWNAIKDLLHPSADLPVSTPIETRRGPVQLPHSSTTKCRRLRQPFIRSSMEFHRTHSEKIDYSVRYSYRICRR